MSEQEQLEAMFTRAGVAYKVKEGERAPGTWGKAREVWIYSENGADHIQFRFDCKGRLQGVAPWTQIDRG